MNNNFILLFILFILINCKKTIKIDKKTPTTKDLILNSAPPIKVQKTKKRLQTKNDFKNVLKSLKNIKHTEDKHSDELTNSSSNFINEIFSLNERDLSVKTTSYTYKENCVFYLHNIKYNNDSLSIKPFLENSQGKQTEGYLGERVLIFAIKNDKEANFIDM